MTSLLAQLERAAKKRTKKKAKRKKAKRRSSRKPKPGSPAWVKKMARARAKAARKKRR